MVTIIHHDGTQETVYASTIPDLWHLAMWLKDADSSRTGDTAGPNNRDRWLKQQAVAVLDCWHLCHELLTETCRQREAFCKLLAAHNQLIADYRKEQP